MLNEELPNSPQEVKELKTSAARFTVNGQDLYKRGYYVPLLKCLGPLKARQALKEMHEGDYGEHFGERVLTAKFLCDMPRKFDQGLMEKQTQARSRKEAKARRKQKRVQEATPRSPSGVPFCPRARPVARWSPTSPLCHDRVAPLLSCLRMGWVNPSHSRRKEDIRAAKSSKRATKITP